LFACQKPADQLVNEDELAFQIVHQVEELWMKLLRTR
jgi:tryptophan 2,3-dioxygenase